MVKTKIIETTEKYDKDGKLIEKITREETTEDDETKQITTFTSSFPNIIPHKQETTFLNTFGYAPLGYPYKKEINEVKITC